MNNSPAIIVVGGGALGGSIAAVLKAKGLNVELVVEHEEQVDLINNNGIKVTGILGTIRTFIPTVSKITSIRQSPDIVLIATRANDMPVIVKDIRPLLRDDSLVVSLQNGIVEEELASIIGLDRTVGCVVGWGATSHGPATMEITSSGEFVIGYLNREADEKLEKLGEILSNIMKVEIRSNILQNLYSKLITDSCVTTVGAICGLTAGKMLSRNKYRKIFIDVIEECMAVADAMGWRIPDFAGKLNYYEFIKWSDLKKHIFLLLFGYKYRRIKSSSLQSLEKGKKTEVAYLNEFVTNKGSDYSIQTPVNNYLIKLVKEIEDGKRKISPSNFSS